MSDEGVADGPVATRLPEPPASSVGMELQDGLWAGEVLAITDKIEGDESAECRVANGRESRTARVDVFGTNCECVRDLTSLEGLGAYRVSDSPCPGINGLHSQLQTVA